MFETSLTAFEKEGGLLGLIILALFILLGLERYIVIFRSGKEIKDVLAAINALHIEMYKAGVLERRKQNVPVEYERRKLRPEDDYNVRRD